MALWENQRERDFARDPGVEMGSVPANCSGPRSSLAGLQPAWAAVCWLGARESPLPGTVLALH